MILVAWEGNALRELEALMTGPEAGDNVLPSRWNLL